ncbi:hypothetical protein [Bradyrhizobium elkanii]|uniref:hypothetical protein n=1 Tax=Bradyrhizobium elkanii TaxID=29448 RepID=UPI002226364A|nr:hypothetical protein [Bradyrhizobium elkanii]MCW2228125.1 hypothetical protein [Bradyrhizobium elkanii]
MKVSITFQSLPGCRKTIWDALAERLGREPTNHEASEEVKRILREAHEELAGAGKLRYQRGLLPWAS